jgi:hypothetical protein
MVRGVSSSHPSASRKAQAPDSGAKRDGASAALASPAGGASASGPALKRSQSFPAHLPSHPFEPATVQPVRKPVTRPQPDTRPPEDFREGGSKREGAELKQQFMGLVEEKHFLRDWLVPAVKGNRDYLECLESMHPKFRSYDWKQVSKALYALALTHPGLIAEIAKKRNELYSIPNVPTSSRLMKPHEQRFLAEAMRLIQEDVRKKPFHMHGEAGVIGDRNGDVVHFDHSPKESIVLTLMQGDKYALHSHPPFGRPFDSSASETDHKVAAETYLEYGNKTREYFTNGKDVMHILPASMGMVRLHPDPKLEETLGEFPVAFKLPDPRQPPYPFANHEAPAAFKKDWAPPAGWTPPEDYPRG